MDESRNPWTTLTEQTVYDNPWIEVKEYQVLNPKGGEGIYGVVSFKNLAIGILPIDEEGNTWLVGQYRYPLKAYSWEIPEGGGQLGVAPLVSAQRELLEEAGLEAKEWTELLRMHLSNSVSDELGIIYLAKGLIQKEAAPEDTEELVLKKLPFLEAYDWAMNGKITDSLSIAALLKAKLLLFS